MKLNCGRLLSNFAFKFNVCRYSMAVAVHADAITESMQGAATEIGTACAIEPYFVELFAEEVIRGGARTLIHKP